MKTIVTSKEEILKACREIVSCEGLQAVNMRAVATKCGVALGTLYNYFPSKDELVLDTIESVWHDIFHMEQLKEKVLSFPETVDWIFRSLQNGANQYPNFFTAHSLSFASAEKSKAKNTMATYLDHMKSGMAAALATDKSVRKDVFSGSFIEEDFLDFVLTGILALLLQQKPDCRVLTEMVRRTIY